MEKIAAAQMAGAVMAGCVPEIMRVLLPLLRAGVMSDNIHGVQATTHFAAPLVIIRRGRCGRQEVGYCVASQEIFFPNVAPGRQLAGRAFS